MESATTVAVDPNEFFNAYPQSTEHFTIYMTDYTPVHRVLHIRTTPFARRDLRGSSEKG